MNPRKLQKKTRIKAAMKYLAILVAVLLVAIFQDYLQSRYNNYSFYASESFLFNMFWILILPIAWMLDFAFSRVSALSQIRSLFLKRILFISFATTLQLLLFAGLVHLVSLLFYEFTFSFGRNLRYTLAADLYIYLLIYSVIAWVVLRKKTPVREQVSTTNATDQLNITEGRTTFAIKTNDICFISAEAPYIAIHTADRKYLHTESLKSVLERVDPGTFVRIHKSTIVNLSKVISYKSRLNGDFDVRLSDQREVRLSRNYVDNFRLKFSRNSSSQ